MATDLGTLYLRVGVRGVTDVTHDLHKVGDAATSASKHFDALERSARSAGGGLGVLDIALGSFIGNLASLGARSLMGGITNMLGTGLRLSQEWEEAAAALRGMGYTAEEVQKKFAFLAKVAAPSIYSKSELIEMTKRLEAYGIAVEGVGLSLAKLGTAFGANREQLLMLTRIMGRLAQGQAPEAEALGAFGVRLQDLAAYGARFSPSGELISGPDENVTAFIRLIENKYSRMFDEMQNTTKARLSYITDMWETAAAKIGTALLNYLAPAFNRIADWLAFISESGVLDRLLNAITRVFHTDLAGLVDVAFSHLVALLMKLPEAVEIMRRRLQSVVDFLKGAFSSIANSVRLIAAAIGFFAGMTVGKAIAALVEMFFMFTKALNGATLAAAALSAMAGKWVALSAGLFGIVGAAVALWLANKALSPGEQELKKEGFLEEGDMAESMKKLFAETDVSTPEGAMEAFKKWREQHSMTEPEQSPYWRNRLAPMAAFEQETPRYIDALRQISSSSSATARNTREMADAFRDLRATIFGGGERTRGAVSSIEAEIALARALGMGIG